MGVIKLSKSKKAILVITDEGVMYTLSVKILSAILGQYQKGEFAVLTRMPMLVSEDRFPKSPVYMSPDTPIEERERLTTANDALSSAQKKKGQENFSKYDDVII
jgi:hypothetical protein